MKQDIEMSNASSNRWWMVIDDLDSVQYKLSDFTLPMITMGVTELGGSSNVSLFTTGDHIQFDEITFSFFVDKKYKNYKALYHWIRDNSKADFPLLKDITIALLDNQGQYQGLTFVYKDAFPILITPILLDGEGDTTDIVVNTTIKFSDFEIINDDELMGEIISTK